jgi:hypothetical protein
LNLLEKTRNLLGRHKKMLIIVTVTYLVLMVLLVVFSGGPQTEPFQYQVR